MTDANEEAKDARHLTLTTLDKYWSAGIPMEMPILGEPLCKLRLDPKNELLTLVTPYAAPEPDVSRLKNLIFSASVAGDENVAELTVRGQGGVHGAYGLLATIADELQLKNTPLAAAVASGIAKHRTLFAGRGGLTAEREVGLFGELLLLEFLFDNFGVKSALDSWPGPLSEEHDFVSDSVHLEVKTTLSERRRHTINGLTQLVPLRGVPLYILSTQVTRSVVGAGRTLPRLIGDVGSAAGGHVVVLDERLEALGWASEDEDLYRTPWNLRTTPRAYRVDADFPAMTPTLLHGVVPRLELVSDVSYRVDVDDLDFDHLPAPFDGFVEAPKGMS